MIRAVRELLHLMHVGRQHWSVAQCERDVERAKEDLALALEARDRAIAELRIAEPPPQVLPNFLRVGYDATQDPYPLRLAPIFNVIEGDRARAQPKRSRKS